MEYQAEFFRNHIEKIQKQMENDSIAIFYSGLENGYRNPFRANSDFYYLTGLHEAELIIILDKINPSVIFRNEISETEKRWSGEKISNQELSKNLNIPSSNILSLSKWPESLLNLLKNKKILYFNYTDNLIFSQIILNALKKAQSSTRGRDFFPNQIHHSNVLMHPARTIKDKKEIDIIKKAAEISAIAHNATMKWVWETQPKYEYEVRGFIEKEFFSQGAEGLAYPSIVAAGKNATYLHYPQYNGKIQKNDLILIDAGCEYHSYASDITRTFSSSGKMNPYQKDIYDIVKKAQSASIEKSIPGNTLEDVHKASVDEIIHGLWDLGFFKKIPDNKNKKKMINPSSISEVKEKEYYKLFYMHKTSHYLGLDVHDSGMYYSQKKAIQLKKNMIFTVEPGIYIPNDYRFIHKEFRGIGIRIEDNILVNSKNSINLTQKAKKDF